MNYWIKYKKCPICETKISRKYADTNGRHKYDSVYCHNGCFDEEIYGSRKECIIFKKYFSCAFNSEEDIKNYLYDVENAIKFWRMNERFLLEILLDQSK